MVSSKETKRAGNLSATFAATCNEKVVLPIPGSAPIDVHPFLKTTEEHIQPLNPGWKPNCRSARFLDRLFPARHLFYHLREQIGDGHRLARPHLLNCGLDLSQVRFGLGYKRRRP